MAQEIQETEEEDIWENEKLAKEKGTSQDVDVKNQVKVKVLRGHVNGVNSCCYLNGRDIIASAGDDKTVRIWNVTSIIACNSSKYTYDGPQDNVLFKDVDCKIQDCYRCVEKRCMTGHKDEITCCRSNPSGRKIVSTALDKCLILWDTETGQPLEKGTSQDVDVKNQVESLHDGMVMSCDISYDGKYMLSCTDLDNSVILWDLRQQKSIKILKHHKSTVLSCRFSRNTHRFCTTSMDLTSCLVDMYDYKENFDPKITLRMGGHVNMISSCDFSLDERYLATASWDKTIMVWDINAGSYRLEGPVVLNSGFEYGGHEGSVSACRFSKDGSTLISTSYDESLVVWDVDNACQKFSLTGHTGWVTDCDFSDDEKAVISSSKDGSIRFWNIEKSDEIPVIMQIKKNIGLKLLTCKQCKKQYSISQALENDLISNTYCVFCRLDRQGPL